VWAQVRLAERGDSEDKPDLSFNSAAGSGPGITGYNMQEVRSFCLEQVLKLGGDCGLHL
jgi:hypothetical protein